MKFEVWWEACGYTRDDAKLIEAYDAAAAAEKLAALKFSDWDYPSFIDGVAVAEEGSEVIRQFDVTVESLPHFAATENKAKPTPGERP